jgi:hypothetical protein
MTDRTLVPLDIVIAGSTTISNEGNTGGKTIVGVIFPSAWTGAGTIVLQALVDEPAANPKVPVFTAIVDDAAAALTLVATVAAARYVAIPVAKQLTGLGRVRAVASVVQAADRRIYLVCV